MPYTQAFRDGVFVRHGWTQTRPQQCICSMAFFLPHVLSSPTGGFPAIRHNGLRDVTARLPSRLLDEVAYNVVVEPGLQPLSGERFRHRTAIREDGARLDIAPSGVAGLGEPILMRFGCSTFRLAQIWLTLSLHYIWQTCRVEASTLRGARS